jgi:hypothetical protein
VKSARSKHDAALILDVYKSTHDDGVWYVKFTVKEGRVWVYSCKPNMPRDTAE